MPHSDMRIFGYFMVTAHLTHFVTWTRGSLGIVDVVPTNRKGDRCASARATLWSALHGCQQFRTCCADGHKPCSLQNFWRKHCGSLRQSLLLRTCLQAEWEPVW